MKKTRYWLLMAILTGLYLSPAWAGSLTDHGFIYRPDLGARGNEEKQAYDAGLARVDTRLGKEIWVGDPNYGSTLQTAVTAIGSNKQILRIPAGIHDVPTDLTISTNITLKPERGAFLAVATGKTLTVQGPLEAGPHQIFSGAGKVWLGNLIPEVYPEWWGAVPDNSTDSGDAIRAALTCLNADGLAYKNVKFSVGTYLVSTGQILQDKAKEMSGQVVAGSGLGITEGTYRLIGDTRGGTVIKFADTAIDALWKVDTKDAYLGGWVLKDLTLEGPGKTAGTNIHGLYFTNTGATYNYSPFKCLLSNMAVTDVSGTGFRSYKFWSSRFDRISANNTGSHGIMLPGFTNTFDNCGQMNYDIGGISLWVLDESPTITVFSTGPCNIGMKFGIEVADKAAEGLPDGLITTSPVSCYPSIDRANIEPCMTTGIVMASGSNFIRGDSISIVAAPGTLTSAITMNGPYRHPGEMRNLYIHPGNGGTIGTFTYNFTVNAVSGNDPPAGLFIYCSSDNYYKWDPAKVTGARACALIPLQAKINATNDFATVMSGDQTRVSFGGWQVDPDNKTLQPAQAGYKLGIGGIPAAWFDLVGPLSTAPQIRLADTVTNSTTKAGRIVIRPYDNSEEDVHLISGATGSGGNSIAIGGGTSACNATSDISLYTALDNHTLTGTQRFRVDAFGNIRVGTGTGNVSGSKQFMVETGSAPSGSITDGFQMYAADQAAGNACAHFRTEAGQIIKLYQQATIANPSGGATQDAEARAAINSILTVLKNNGLIAP